MFDGICIEHVTFWSIFLFDANLIHNLYSIHFLPVAVNFEGFVTEQLLVLMMLSFFLAVIWNLS